MAGGRTDAGRKCLGERDARRPRPGRLRAIDDGQPQLLTAPMPASSSLTHPVWLSSNQQAFIDTHYQLVLWREQKLASLPVSALLDARILVDPLERLLFLTTPTKRYAHNVLGDGVEAASITLVEALPVSRVLQTIELADPVVVEGLAPIWADITGDGKRDIIVTLSDQQQGARIAVFDESGERSATGPAIGQGYRWRHQLAVAPFGPNGETELVSVRTPHIGGMVEFYRREGVHLRPVAQVLGSDGQSDERTHSDAVAVGDFMTVPMDGFNSHILGSRNLDMAVAGDFDGDGQVELLVPNQKRTVLAAIRRDSAGASVVWALPLNGQLSTNLATVTFPDGSIAIGAGHSGQGLRLWL